jgi:hypothetical protein
MIFQERLSKVLKCYNFLWLQWRHNCSPAASFSNCAMAQYLLKVHLKTFSFYTSNSKMPNFELWHSCRKWTKYMYDISVLFSLNCFSCAFEKLRKATISFVVSVRPSYPQWTTRLPLDGFSRNVLFRRFSTICRENSTFIKNHICISDTLREDQYTFLTISRPVLFW